MSPIDNGRGILFFINKTRDYSIRQQTKKYHEIIICDLSIDKKHDLSGHLFSETKIDRIEK